MSTIIELSGVSKSYGGVRANTDVSQTVEKGAITGVKKDLDRVEHEIETAYRRWEELEAMKLQANPQDRHI